MNENKNYQKRRVLILYSNVGGGHYSISKVLKTIIEENCHYCEVKLENIMPGFTPDLYRTSTLHFPNIYLELWKLTDYDIVARLLHFVGFLVITPKINAILKKFNPDVIISTSGSSTYEVGRAKRVKPNVPHIVVIADPFTIHSGWTTYKNADLFIAPTKESYEVLIEREIEPGKINITGWPIRKEFYRNHPKKTFIKSLSLDPQKLIIFIGGSGEGQGNIYEVAKKLSEDSNIREKCQTIVVCGKHINLYQKLKIIESKYPSFLKVHGYVEEIHKFMCISDLIIGKPGPNLLFESVLLGKPFLATGAPIGQEVGNYHFIEKENIGKICRGENDVVKHIKDIFSFPKILETYTSNVLRQKEELIDTHQKIWKAIKPYIV